MAADPPVKGARRAELRRLLAAVLERVDPIGRAIHHGAGEAGDRQSADLRRVEAGDERRVLHALDEETLESVGERILNQTGLVEKEILEVRGRHLEEVRPDDTVAVDGKPEHPEP